jgi:ribosomal protein S12 methylthiotransferase
VPGEAADERYNALMEIQAEIAESFHRSLVGRTFDMIVDSTEPDKSLISGRTYMDAPDVDGNVTVSGSVEEDKPFLRVRITGAGQYDLTGETVE